MAAYAAIIRRFGSNLGPFEARDSKCRRKAADSQKK